MPMYYGDTRPVRYGAITQGLTTESSTGALYW